MELVGEVDWWRSARETRLVKGEVRPGADIIPEDFGIL